MADTKDSKRFTLARKEKQNADVIRKQNLARIFLTSILNEDIEQDDMSVALQDGVLLCKMINSYKPDSIKKFNATPRTPFKMMENASFVVDFGKKNQLGVNFTADDITNKEHLILILTFILNIAEKMGWTPPLLADITTSPPISHSPDLYSPSPTPGDVSSITAPPISSPSPTPTQSSSGRSTPNKGTSSVKSILIELIASERDFILDMELFFKLYVGPSKSLLPAEKTNAIFGNIDNVVGANNKFIMELQMVLDGYMSISSVWKNFASAINIYSVYCIFQQNSYGLIEQCRREFPGFEAHLKTVEYTVESKNVGIFNFLVKPFARVVKYNSTLKQLLQTVPPGEDYDLMTECKKEFQDLSDTTSETWKKVENSRKIAEISGNLVGAEKAGLRKLGRIYLREGDFTLNGKSTKLFLFSDIIVYAVPVKALLKKSGGKSHIFKGIIPLNACTLHDLPDGKEGKNVIELLGTGEQKYKIVASSASDKRLWLTDISKAITKFQGSQNRDQHPTNHSPLEPRPMLGGGMGRSSPARHNSQTQIVEERRKTVKLAFASHDEDEDEDEKDEVQLEMKEASIPISEEDKRKTIKLEFAGRQLSVRDRSQTVDLTFKKEENNEEGENEEEEEDSGTTIVDRRKTVKLDFKIPRPSPSPSPSDIEEGHHDEEERKNGEGHHVEEERKKEEERDHLENSGGNGTENEFGSENGSVSEHREDNDLEILSSDMRNDTAHYNASENSDTDDVAKESVNLQIHINDNNEHNNHLSDSKDIEITFNANESTERVERIEKEDRVEKVDTEDKEEIVVQEIDIVPAAERQVIEQQESEELISPFSVETTHHETVVEKALVPASHSIGNSDQDDAEESENIIAALIGEIKELKSELKVVQEKADQTAKDLEKEKEETKVWKTRVERILSVLLDAMKQSTNSRSESK